LQVHGAKNRPHCCDSESTQILALRPNSFQAGLAQDLGLIPQELAPQADQGLQQLLPASDLAVPRKCQTCGGSGVLRLSAMGFRTCLDCAGQGLLPVVPASSAFGPQPDMGQAIDQLVASTRPSRSIPASERFRQEWPL
jgi:hypothetical protein